MNTLSDTADQSSSNSQSHLIEVHHVGVTAKLQSPLKKLLPRLSASIDTDIFQQTQSAYNVFANDSTETNVSTDVSTPRVLYQMHTEPELKKPMLEDGLKPQRIEFQRYSKIKRPHFVVPPRKTNNKKRVKQSHSQASKMQPNFFQRICQSLDKMCQCQPQHTRNIIDGLPEPHWNKKAAARHTCIGIYPFEHGCADYLSTTDTHPKINAIVLADRATTYATHFWAEIFGLLHIVVAFVVAFLLQSYRFILYSLINTLLVGLLHMTSDYLFKPALTVVFNGFLQPPLIFVYNIFCSMRDILEPVADCLNNFMKPLATLGNSLRLINVNYRNVRRAAAEV